jgi:hypothetical protein
MRYVIAAMVILSCAVCAADKPMAAGAGEGSKTRGVLITRLVGRRDVIVVRAGTEGPTYSLETKSGEVLVPGVTRGKLAMTKPTFSKQVRTMQASNDWAGIDTDIQD